MSINFMIDHQRRSKLDIRNKFAWIVFLLLASTPSLLAQVDTGQIAGVVIDTAGAVVAGAEVKATSITTGAIRATTCNNRGEYVLSDLPIGPYNITINDAGFGQFSSNAVVDVGAHVTMDAQLGVQAKNEVVEVSAGEAGATINTTNFEVGQTISGQQLADLPSLTRNPYDFVALSGNAAMDPNGSTARGVGVSLSGSRAASTEILLDGVENVDLFAANTGQQIPLDGVEEYSVITSGFSAEYGRASGGIVNLASKSGTNNYHGSLYEFNRVSALASNTYYEDATNYYNKTNGLPLLPHDQFTENRFGYSVGGPLLPKFKDKVFFFSSTEWNRVRSSGTQPFAVPTPAFLATAAPNVQAYFTQYGTLASYATVGQSIAVPGFTGPNPLEIVSVKAPINAGAGSPINSWDTIDRVDYNPTDKTNMFFRYVGYKDLLFDGSNSLSPYVGYNTGEDDFNQAVLASVNHVFTPNLILSTKFAYNRLTNTQPLGTAPVGPGLYLNATNVASIDNVTGTLIGLPGYLPLDPGGAIPFGGPQNFYQFQPDLTWTKGAHSLHFGATYVQLRDNRTFGAYENAIQQIAAGGTGEAASLAALQAGTIYSFQAAVYPQGKYPCYNSAATNTPIVTPACTVDLPVGPPSFTRENTFNDGSVYAQDNWKIMTRLTLNLGLRWEYYGVQHNTKADLESNFFPATGGNIFENIRNGAVETTPNSPVGGLIAQQFHNFGPRLGFAYDVFGDGKWSVRGGYGIAYERNFGNVTFNVMFNPPNYAVINQVTGQNGVGQQTLTSENYGPLSGSGSAALPHSELRALAPHLNTAYNNMYSLSVEHQVSQGTLVALEYTGTRGIHQYSIAPENTPYYGNEYLGDTTPGLPLNLQYGPINVRESNGDAYYNGLNLRVQENNFGRYGLQLTANYTLAHAMDNLSSTFSESVNNFNLGYINGFNPALDHGNADYDIRNRLALAAIYQPKFLEFNQNHIAHTAFGGLEFAPIFSAQTGTPFSIYDESNILGYSTPRIQTAQGLKYHASAVNTGGVDSYKLQTIVLNSHNPYYNAFVASSEGVTPSSTPYGPFAGGGGSEIPTCASPGGGGCYQDPGMDRNQFWSPANWNLDIGVYKNFAATERLKVQLRGEFYNILNHHNMYVVPFNSDYAELTPETQDENGNFVPNAGPGNIQGIRGSPGGSASASDERRQVQLALKFQF